MVTLLAFVALTFADEEWKLHPSFEHDYDGAQNQSDDVLQGISATYLKGFPIRMDEMVGRSVAAATPTLFAVGSVNDFVYIVRLTEDGWMVTQKLVPIGDGGEHYATSLVLTSSYLLVGSPYDISDTPGLHTSPAIAGSPQCGTVHVYVADDSEKYLPTVKLAPPSTSVFSFGAAMAVTQDGSLFIVSAPRDGHAPTAPVTPAASFNALAAPTDAENGLVFVYDALGGAKHATLLSVLASPYPGARGPSLRCADVGLLVRSSRSTSHW